MRPTSDEAERRRESLPISVCITTKDNADTIRRCLESVHDWTDEIVVVDSDSQDGTIEICEEYGANVYQHEFKGFGYIKTKSMEHATNDWVFILDADEEVSADLRREILKSFGEPGVVAFRMRKREYILGGWSHHYHDEQPVLAKKQALYYQQEHLWERPTIEEGAANRIKDLTNPLYNYKVERVSEMETKMMQYSALEAFQTVELDKRDGAIFMVLKGLAVATHRLIVGKGILDGYRGVFMAFMDFYQQVSAFMKVRDIRRLQEQRPEKWREIWFEEECRR